MWKNWEESGGIWPHKRMPTTITAKPTCAKMLAMNHVRTIYQSNCYWKITLLKCQVIFWWYLAETNPLGTMFFFTMSTKMSQLRLPSALNHSWCYHNNTVFHNADDDKGYCRHTLQTGGNDHVQSKRIQGVQNEQKPIRLTTCQRGGPLSGMNKCKQKKQVNYTTHIFSCASARQQFLGAVSLAIKVYLTLDTM